VAKQWIVQHVQRTRALGLRGPLGLNSQAREQFFGWGSKIERIFGWGSKIGLKKNQDSQIQK